MVSSIGVFVLLVAAAVAENLMKDWQAIQRSARGLEGPIEVRLRQIVNPELRTTDRCVTCHVGMAPGEQISSDSKVGAAHKPVFHSVTEMGCTVCHGGQGQATEKDDAHGEVQFWTEPMLPTKYAYAGCGTCHSPPNVPNLETLTEGRRTFERLDCYACHRVDGRGGTVRPGKSITGMEGPDLSTVGIKGFDRDWYRKHTEKSRADQNWALLFKEIEEQEIAELNTFLSTRMGAPKLIEAKAQFNSLGCAGCHVVGSFGGDAGPNLSTVGLKDPNRLDFSRVPGERSLENWIKQHFRSPASTVAGSQMPPLGLTDQQIDLLTLYALSLRRRILPDTYLPKDRVRTMRFGIREFSNDPATIYSAVCSACHGADGKGRRYAGLVPNPSIANPDFLALASDEFLAATIQSGRPGRPMLAWGDRENGLTGDEIRALVQYIRTLGGGINAIPDKRPKNLAVGDVKMGERLYVSNCAGCHGIRDAGGEGPAIGNKVFLENVSDTFLFGTISRGRNGTIMQGFSTGSATRNSLTDWKMSQSLFIFERLDSRLKTNLATM